ncbi:MAG: hypothetical protein QOJ96_1413 [Alphaproteobacteria bacterium]|jgi:hypothetical protein|nr:hypothetical protein [Alphaproteobacteria bacterium]
MSEKISQAYQLERRRLAHKTTALFRAGYGIAPTARC